MIGSTIRLNGSRSGRALREAIAGSTPVELSQAGHVCNVDAGDRFNDALRTFLNSHSPG